MSKFLPLIDSRIFIISWSWTRSPTFQAVGSRLYVLVWKQNSDLQSGEGYCWLNEVNNRGVMITFGAFVETGWEGECSGMWRMKVCLILMGDKLLAAKETLLCKTGLSPTRERTYRVSFMVWFDNEWTFHQVQLFYSQSPEKGCHIHWKSCFYDCLLSVSSRSEEFQWTVVRHQH